MEITRKKVIPAKCKQERKEVHHDMQVTRGQGKQDWGWKRGGYRYSLIRQGAGSKARNCRDSRSWVLDHNEQQLWPQ